MNEREEDLTMKEEGFEREGFQRKRGGLIRTPRPYSVECRW